MDLKRKQVMQRTVRMNVVLWDKIAAYADGVEFRSENELFIHLIETGLQALSDPPTTETPDKDLEPPKYDEVTEGYKPKKEEPLTEGNTLGSMSPKLSDTSKRPIEPPPSPKKQEEKKEYTGNGLEGIGKVKF